MKARFGIVLPVTSGTSAWDYSLNFERMKSFTKKCEALGYESVWSPDHFMTGRDGNTFEAWTVLAGLSQVTETMRLGTLVTCPTHRAPPVLAKIVATLDVMSNGRVDLGIGAGWCGYEQLAFNLPWEEVPKARIRRLVETIEILRGMWNNDTFSYKGYYYTVTNAICNPKPIQKPPKILMGGKGEKVFLKMVAKYADAWNIDELSPEDYAKKLEVIKGHCKEVGTDYGRIEKTLETYVLVSDRKEDYQRLADWASMSSQNSMERKRIGRPPHTATVEEVMQDFLVGSVDQIIEKVGKYIDVGVQRFMIYFMDFPSYNSVLPFAREVFPSVE